MGLSGLIRVRRQPPFAAFDGEFNCDGCNGIRIVTHYIGLLHQIATDNMDSHRADLLEVILDRRRMLARIPPPQ